MPRGNGGGGAWISNRDLATALLGRRAGSAIGSFAEGGAGSIGQLVVGLQFGLERLATQLNNTADVIDKAFARIAPRQQDVTSAAQQAATIAGQPTTGPFGGQTVMSNVLKELGMLAKPGGLFNVGAILFGRQPESGPRQFIDSMSAPDLMQAIPTITDPDLRKYAEKKLRDKVGNMAYERGAQAAFAASGYGAQIATGVTNNINVNGYIGDRNSQGLAIRAALDARDRNNGRYTSNFSRRG